MKEIKTIYNDDVINFVYDKLLDKGFDIDKDLLEIIFDLEIDYLCENGVATK